jgi:hypothetical protein
MTDAVVADAPVESAMMDRIASKFGFPGEDQAAVEPAQAVQAEESNLADLEWDGQVYQVPKTLKDGFMRNQDYTQKSQELASQRTSLDHVRTLAEQRQLDAAFSESIQTEQQELHVIDAYLAQAQKVDWTNMSTDQILRQKIELDQIKERRQSLQESITGKRTKFRTDMDTKISELRSKARDIASKEIKDFSEETEKSVKSFLGSQGLAEAEISNVLLDPRSYKIVWKAMQFDQISSKQATATVDKVLKGAPQTERMPAQTVAKLNFNKAMKNAETSSDKAKVIEARLATMFKGR